MARKLPGLRRVLGAPALFAVAYGEVASSIYIALGIVAAYALGLTPVVLAAAGLLFFVVALSYTEAATTTRETGGAATFTRIAFNDLAGFVTGWALFLDYLIVIALSALFLSHYVGETIGVHALRDSPWDVAVACSAIAAIAGARLIRRSRLYLVLVGIAFLDLTTQLLVVMLGLAFVFSPDALTSGLSVGDSPTWHDLAFALPLAMLAYTGLETVANLAEEARRPGRDLPRSVFGAVGLVILVYVAIASVALSAFPARGGETALAGEWLRAPVMGLVSALDAHVPSLLGDALRIFVGVSASLILLLAITTAISGFSRLAYSLGEHAQLPRPFGLLNRRTLVSPHAIVAAAGTSIALLLAATATQNAVTFLASLFSFGVLLAFTAAQVAVIKLRISEPERRRPFRVPLGVRVRGAEIPLVPVVGALATTGAFAVAVATHSGARYGGPAWLAAGLVLYVVVRRRLGHGLLAHVAAADEQVLPEAQFRSVLVPMKLGIIGEEMLATAIRLAGERGARVEALHVVRVPLDKPLDADMLDQEISAAAALAEARMLGHEHGVHVTIETVRARSIGEAIVREAELRSVDLIVLGSSPRWRRQSRFFSPTVDYVLRKAPCEVLVVAYPQAVMDAEAAFSS